MKQEITFDKFVRWTGMGLLVIAILLLVNYLSNVLLPFFIAWLLAYLLYPAVKFIQYKLKVRVRAIAIIIAMLLVLAFVALVTYLIVPPMIEQFEKLERILRQWLSTTTHSNDITATISGWIQQNQAEFERFFKSRDFADAVKTAMPKVFSFVGQTASIILSIVASIITLLYMFFILLDYELLTTNWIRIFPKKNRPFWSELMQSVERELNNYIRGQGLVALCMGIMFCIGFTIIDFPVAIGLGILIGILGALPSHLCAHPYGVPCHAQGGRHGAELLVGVRRCSARVLRCSGNNGLHRHTEDHGQGNGPQPSHSPLESVRLGRPAGLHRTDHRPATHHTPHRLLATLCHQRRQNTVTSHSAGR